jgi:FlaA1/EpsC-like NDP-sugar epimerase
MIDRILITGARGSIGTALRKRLEGFNVLATDKDTLDVTNPQDVGDFDLVYHLAGAKSAPDGEADPETAVRVNAVGTLNMVRLSEDRGARFVLASTCKAADPETAYGASKLLAEKIVLAAGGVVCRFYNVRETCGNVFETWRNIPAPGLIPVTPCRRYFISSSQAVDLLIEAATLPSGRYTVDPGPAWDMTQVAKAEYPGRDLALIPPRRGDRLAEPLCASNERLEPFDGVLRIISAHDPVVEAVCV